MVEKLERQCCANCIYLDKGRMELSDLQNYRYGCNCNEFRDGWICFWCMRENGEKELRTGGCSNYNRIYIGTKFVLYSEEHEHKVLYCGKVGNKRLLYNLKLKTKKLVDNDWFLNRRDRIKIIYFKDNKFNTREEKVKFNKKLAKSIKKRWLKEHEKE